MKPAKVCDPLDPSYTIREAAAVSTKTATAIRSMVDRGDLPATNRGRRGSPRKIARSALIEAGIFRADGELPAALRAFHEQLALFQSQTDANEERLEQLELLQATSQKHVDARLDLFERELTECRELMTSLLNQLAGRSSELPAAPLRHVA